MSYTMFNEDEARMKRLLVALARGHAPGGFTEAQAQTLVAKIAEADATLLMCDMAAEGTLDVFVAEDGDVRFKTNAQKEAAS